MLRKCKTCDSYMFKDENDEWVCPNCESETVLTSFYQSNDFWLNNLAQI